MLVTRSLLVLTLFTLGATSSVAQTRLHFFHGDDAFDQMGTSVASAGDVNGDGVPDIIAGAIGDATAGSNAGMARVWSGADGAVLYTFLGSGAGDEFGQQVAGAGDVNGDGFDDLLVASRYIDPGDTSGNAQVFSGADGSLLYTFAVSVSGNAVVGGIAGIGDVDGDGKADVAVGVPDDDTADIGAGSVRVYSGATGNEIFAVYGTRFDRLGTSVAAAGDINGDGTPDLVVGLRGWTFGPNPMGAALVLSGVDGSVLLQVDGDTPQSGFGRTVAGVGDMNADGIPDFAVGDPIHGSLAGRVRVYSGLDGALLHEFDGHASGAQLGISISPGGDLDGDGHADIYIGLLADIGNLVGSGSGRIYSGADGTLLDTIRSNIANDGFGRSVALVGDVNGDGVQDYAGGAYLGDVNGSASGSVHVFSLVGLITPYCTSLPNSAGLPAIMGWDGVGSLSSHDLVLSVSQLPPTSVGLILRGQVQQQTPLGNGFLCIGGAQRVFPVLTAGADGTVTSPMDTGVWPNSSLYQLGATWNFQYWYRDAPAGGAGFNFSDGLSVTFLP